MQLSLKSRNPTEIGGRATKLTCSRELASVTPRQMNNLPSKLAGTGLDDVGLVTTVVTEGRTLNVGLHVFGTSWSRRLSSVWNSSVNM